MLRKEAKKILDNTFNNAFDKKTFANFLNELLNGFYLNEKQIGTHSEYEENISSIRKMGNFKDNGKSMEIFVVKLKKSSTLERARTLQRNVIAKLLKNFNLDSSLVAFYSEDSPDWRFSFVKMDYKLLEGGKVSAELTPAKRYSFLVGENEPNHTCRKQLLNLVVRENEKPTIEEIENAFSVENVTKEFFEKYKNLFISLKENLEKVIENDLRIKKEFGKDNVSVVEFSKKLLGQIVFLYFLQKKGWLGIKKSESGEFNEWGTGSKKFVQELFEDAKKQNKNFFNDYLEPLFYEALAEDRRANGNYYSRFECRIPFLNGGLFEPMNNYNWQETNISLDNNLFNDILGTFNEFNFTIKEDEPLEKEVAVDPEMLGKVFENLLDITDRKSKGAFYTPREIVHYMCQQSLINYLETNSDVGRSDLEIFIQKGDLALDYLKRVLAIGKGVKEELILPESIRKNYEFLDKLLQKIKIVDPAVGSGAFPVGMMNEIIKAREILNHFSMDGKKSDYELKRETIENSLYGVDIEPSAVEITKLRFWLSLIVDEEDMDNIKPLPNLENRIMCGNSLMEEFEGVKLYKDPSKMSEKQTTLNETISNKIKKSEKKLKELRNKQKEFFDVSNRTIKNELREEIEAIEWEFIKETLKEQDNPEALEKLERIKKDKSKPFFLWKLYFSDVFEGDNPGFDIVVGNPPYLGFRNLERKIKEDIRRNFVSGKGKFDLYVPFIEKGISLLRGEGGFLTYICPTSFMKRDYGIHIREFILSNSRLDEVIDFGHSQIFDSATNYTGIISLKSSKNGKFLKSKKTLLDKGFDIELNLLSGEPWVFLNKRDERIINKIRPHVPLSKISDISEGVVTGLNKLYLLKTGDIQKNNLENDLFFSCIGGREIGKYRINDSKELLFYPYILEKEKTVPIAEDVLLKKVPNYMKFLRNNLDLINNRSYFSKSNKRWYELWNQRRKILFDSKKIVTPELSDRNRFALAKEGVFYGDTVCGIKLHGDDNEFSEKYVLAILNSSTIEWFYKKTTVPKAGGFYIYKVMFLKNIPIKRISREKQKPFIEIVDKVLEITKEEDYLKNQEKQAKVKAYEKKIDKMVYELYDLISEEIKIIEKIE